MQRPRNAIAVGAVEVVVEVETEREPMEPSARTTTPSRKRTTSTQRTLPMADLWPLPSRNVLLNPRLLLRHSAHSAAPTNRANPATPAALASPAKLESPVNPADPVMVSATSSMNDARLIFPT
jgi:hypothetical protein